MVNVKQKPYVKTFGDKIRDIIIKRGEISYKKLNELERGESSVRNIPLESYVYAYLKLIHNSYRYVIDTHLQEKMGPMLDNLQNKFNLVMKDL